MLVECAWAKKQAVVERSIETGELERVPVPYGSSVGSRDLVSGPGTTRPPEERTDRRLVKRRAALSLTCGASREFGRASRQRVRFSRDLSDRDCAIFENPKDFDLFQNENACVVRFYN